ncbi:unnamed protein product [Ectocarpus fasciculatus]
MLCGTGAPPALLGVLGVGDESPGNPQPSEALEKEGDEGQARGVPQEDEAGVTTSAEIATPGEGDEVLGDAAGAVAVDAPSRDGEEEEEEEEEVEAEAEAAAAAAVRDMPEDVLKVAKECVVYEDVSGVITAVYAARYGTDAAGKAPAVPLWVRQMASLARLAGRTDTASAAAAAAAGNAGGSGDGSDPHPNDGAPSTLAGGNGGGAEAAAAAAAAAAAERGGADAVVARAGVGAGGGTEKGARGIDSGDGLRGGGVRSCWRTRAAAGNIAARGHRRGGCSVAEGGGTTTVREGLRRGGGFLPVLAARSRRSGLVGRAADVARRLRGGG